MEKGTCVPSGDGYNLLILADLPEIRSKRGNIETKVTDLPVTVGQNRNEIPVAALKFRCRIHIHDIEYEPMQQLLLTQRRDHVVTQMTVAAPVDRKARPAVSLHRA